MLFRLEGWSSHWQGFWRATTWALVSAGLFVMDCLWLLWVRPFVLLLASAFAFKKIILKVVILFHIVVVG